MKWLWKIHFYKTFCHEKCLGMLFENVLKLNPTQCLGTSLLVEWKWYNSPATSWYFSFLCLQCGELPNSFRLISVVSHIGSSSSSGKDRTNVNRFFFLDLARWKTDLRSLKLDWKTQTMFCSNRSLHQWRVRHEEAVVVDLQWLGCVAHAGSHSPAWPRPQRLHLLLHAQVSWSNNECFFFYMCCV